MDFEKHKNFILKLAVCAAAATGLFFLLASWSPTDNPRSPLQSAESILLMAEVNNYISGMDVIFDRLVSQLERLGGLEKEIDQAKQIDRQLTAIKDVYSQILKDSKKAEEPADFSGLEESLNNFLALKERLEDALEDFGKGSPEEALGVINTLTEMVESLKAKVVGPALGIPAPETFLDRALGALSDFWSKIKDIARKIVQSLRPSQTLASVQKQLVKIAKKLGDVSDDLRTLNPTDLEFSVQLNTLSRKIQNAEETLQDILDQPLESLDGQTVTELLNANADTLGGLVQQLTDAVQTEDDPTTTSINERTEALEDLSDQLSRATGAELPLLEDLITIYGQEVALTAQIKDLRNKVEGARNTRLTPRPLAGQPPTGKPPVCGNGIIEGGETCDPPVICDNGKGCQSNCALCPSQPPQPPKPSGDGAPPPLPPPPESEEPESEEPAKPKKDGTGAGNKARTAQG